MTTSAETYIISTTPEGFPFQRGVAEISITDGVVSGEFTPLRYYTANHFKVTGSNDRDGEIDITIASKPPRKVTLKKKISNDGEVAWTGGGFHIFRIHGYEFSEAALALTVHECGGINGDIRIELSRNATKRQITEFFAGPGKHLNAPLTWEGCGGRTVAEEAVCDLERQNKRWKEEGFDDVYYGTMLTVPVGSELAVLKLLRPLPWIHRADLDPGGCGGGISRNVNIPMASAFGQPAYSRKAAQKMIEDDLRKAIGRGNSVLADLKFVDVPASHFGFKAEILVFGDAKGIGKEGNWLTFRAAIEPTDNPFAAKGDFSMDVYAYDIGLAPKKAGDNGPPRKTTRYKIWKWDEGESQEAEFYISQVILAELAALHGGWCDRMDEIAMNMEVEKVLCRPDPRASLVFGR